MVEMRADLILSLPTSLRISRKSRCRSVLIYSLRSITRSVMIFPMVYLDDRMKQLTKILGLHSSIRIILCSPMSISL